MYQLQIDDVKGNTLFFGCSLTGEMVVEIIKIHYERYTELVVVVSTEREE